MYEYIIIASLSPVGELRAAIPLGLALGLDLLTLVMVAIFANILIIPLMFLVLKFAGFRKIFFTILGKRIERKIDKHRARFETYGELALIPFAAIPLPGSGAYTATIIAEVLGYNRLKSGLAIAIGVCLAAIIVMLASLGIISAL
jgi:uncharacterized membrane protein